ncbi:hypothetical protein L7F22_034691 [Adiantum nelumboides]|nr:hypothetical protein [Adiantum nelumboides]
MSLAHPITKEESTIIDDSDSSQAKIMGVVLTDPAMVSSSNVPQVEEGKLAKMLAKDLMQEERQAYMAMLEGYPRLFIDGYDQIIGVSVVQHHINLKEEAKPVVQQLRRLGVVQQDALLSEVRKLLNVGFIYPVENSEWVSPVVVTPKKNGKWWVCVDYKPLNAATKRDHFPLQFQDEILNEVASYESSRVLHLEKVNEGLARLQSLGGQLNVDKCHIAESQVAQLGHVVYSRGKELGLRRVPHSKDIKQVLISYHEGVCGGHFAHDITSRNILQAGYVWPILHCDVQHWCKTCKQCQLASDRHLTYEPQTLILSYGPFEKWGIDAIGPLPRGSGFRVGLVGELMKKLGIERRHSTPYYPQCNGLVEIINGMICKIITKPVVSKPEDWDKHLSVALWAYRTSFRTSLGYASYHLVFGKEAILPIEVQLASLKILATKIEGTPDDQLKQRILNLERLELD